MEWLVLFKKLRIKSSLICDFFNCNHAVILIINLTMNFNILTIALILTLAAAGSYPLYKQCDSRWAN